MKMSLRRDGSRKQSADVVKNERQNGVVASSKEKRVDTPYIYQELITERVAKRLSLKGSWSTELKTERAWVIHSLNRHLDLKHGFMEPKALVSCPQNILRSAVQAPEGPPIWPEACSGPSSLRLRAASKLSRWKRRYEMRGGKWEDTNGNGASQGDGSA